ncbi:cyclic Di-GMP phosphodiesterase RmdA [Rhodococcus aerolatus]
MTSGSGDLGVARGWPRDLATASSGDGDAAVRATARVGTFEVVDLATGRARWSDNCWRLLGLEPGHHDPPRYRDLVHPDDHDAVVAVVDRVVAAGGSATTEHRVLRPDGEVRRVVVHTTAQPDPGTGLTCALVGVIVDVTDDHRTRRQRDRAEETLRVGFERSMLGVGITDVTGTVLTVNPTYAAILGRAPEEIVGRPWTTFVHPADLAAAVEPRVALLAGEVETFRAGHRVVRADGSTRWVDRSVTLVDDDEQPVFLTQVVDVTEAHLAAERLEHLAHHDELTGLPNRTALTERLDHALATVAPGRVVTCVFVDLDGFTLVNDGLGHAAGDELLRQVTRRLQRVLEPGDTLARFGGDSFVVVRRDCPPDRAADVGREALALLEQPFALDGLRVAVSACAGVASGAAGRDGDAVLREADTAVTRAKNRGPHQLVVFDADLAADVAQRLDTAVALRGAVGRGEVVVHYQPAVALGGDDERVVVVEALVRWQHPTRGLVGPDEFVPSAERTGLIHEIGTHVLREAFRTVARWRRELPGAQDLHVAVNVSTVQLRDGDLRAVVAGALAETGLPAGAVYLEVTESGVMDDVAGGTDRLRELRGDGVNISVDDFGTGYSALGYLMTLPVDAVKLDRAFVTALTDPASAERARQVVAGIVALCAALGAYLVAEGVELPEQLALLRRLGVSAVQGFLVSPALAAAELESWWGSALPP